MEVDVASFQMDFPGSPIMRAAGRRISTEYGQLSGGLMRYHSAPSSMLASLVDEEFYPRDSSLSEEFEFARFLSNSLGSSSAFHSSTVRQVDEARGGSIRNEIKELQHSDPSRMIARQSPYAAAGGSDLMEDVKSAPLCAIFESGLEDSLLDNCCRDQVPSNEQVVQSSHQSTTESSCYSSLMMSGSEFSGRPQETSNLIRHRSSPAGFLSRLAMDEFTEAPIAQFSGPYMLPSFQNMPVLNSGGKNFVQGPVGTAGTGLRFSMANCLSGEGSIGENNDGVTVGTRRTKSTCEPSNSGLLRQSSSPAGLLSQLSLDGISTVCEKVSLSASSGNSSEEGIFDGRGAAASVGNYGAASWEEVGTGHTTQNAVAFGQRKRGRDIEAKILRRTSLTDSVQRYAADDTKQPNISVLPTNTSLATAVCMESLMVPCKARAKRGCATHPRSIAERVRRTKISERMRKLQELVPNMDKQTNTADMLDEAVEYIRSLQRQVQELSETRSMCNGRCQFKGHTSL